MYKNKVLCLMKKKYTLSNEEKIHTLQIPNKVL